MKIVRFTGFILALGAMASVAAGDASTNTWKTTATLAATLTSGNSDTLSLGAGIATQKKWEQNELMFGAGLTYGETEDKVTASSANGYGQYNRLLSNRVYGFARVDAMHDDVADVAYRVTLSAGAGYYLVKTDKMTLSVEAGPGYVWERIGAQREIAAGVYERYWDDRDYMTIRFGERFTWQITSTARFWESVSYTPCIDDWGDYVINAEAGIAARISEHLDLRLVAQDDYRSIPAAGRKSNDFKLMAGVGYTF